MTRSSIVVDPTVLAGKTVVRGTPSSVELLRRKLSEGASIDDLVETHPRLIEADIHAASAYAEDTIPIEETSNATSSSGRSDASTLRFPIAEYCDDILGRAPRAAGHDVAKAASIRPAAPDPEVA